MKKILLEIDDLTEERQESLELIMELMTKEKDWKFDKIFNQVSSNPIEAWDAVKEASEIFIDSALIARAGMITSGDFMNNFMYKASAQNVVGKKLFIFRPSNKVQWKNLRKSLLVNCFKNNELYTLEEDEKYERTWQKVNIKKLISEM